MLNFYHVSQVGKISNFLQEDLKLIEMAKGILLIENEEE